MIKVVNARLLSVFIKTAASNSYLKCRTFFTVANHQKNVVKSFSMCRNYCTSNSNEDVGDSDSIYENMNFNEVTNGDPELMNKLKLLMLQIENFRHEGKLVPKKITVDEWKYMLLELSNPYARTKYLTFLAKNEFKQQNEKIKREQQKFKFIEKRASINVPDHINYGLGRNSLFMRIKWSSIINLAEAKCCTAMLHSNNIVFDLDYEKYMTPNEIKNCAKQILLSADMNRFHVNPLNLHLCNFPNDGKMKNILDRYFGYYASLKSGHIHEESYSEVFDPRSVVYLSPHAKEDLLEYNPDDVYVIGAYVDKGASLPVSFGKAKAEKIRSVKFPLDVYFKWKQGNKSLPINIVLGVMLDLNYFKDMKKALIRNIPSRLYYKDHELQELYETTSPRARNSRKKIGIQNVERGFNF